MKFLGISISDWVWTIMGLVQLGTIVLGWFGHKKNSKKIENLKTDVENKS